MVDFRWLRAIRVGNLQSFHRSIINSSTSTFSLWALFRHCVRTWLNPLMPYYAVRKGRQVGIYETWTECEAQVKKFAGAQFKKFAVLAEARAFLVSSPTVLDDPNTNSVASSGRKRNFHTATTRTDSGDESTGNSDESSSVKRQRTSNSDDSVSSFTVVYTDGACTNNGLGSARGARGGIGVYWGPDDARNVSEPLPIGRQTNNRAEILACARAIEQAKESEIKRLEIRTDSRFTISCMTEYLSTWLRNGWMTQGGKPVRNMEELIILNDHKQKFEKSGGQIKFVHVSGHSGEPGNEAADRLAVEGIRKG